METLNRYILVCDNCKDCTYVANAFTLIRFPLSQLTITNLLESEDNFTNVAAVILCKEVEASNGKRILEKFSGTNAHIISFNENTRSTPTNLPIQHLKMPFSYSELKRVLAQCEHSTFADNFYDITKIHPIFERLIGESQEIRKIRSLIKQVASSDSTVLILGQSGTGKDVIASCIHYLSERRDKALVPINCGAIPGELMESELFGHEKGAFTGALSRRAGRFEIADGGTLFLDEIGDMPLPMQVKLLRVIQERIIDRVGGNASIKVDVRLIAATNKHLETLIKDNKFREDLFYRLNVFPINVPTLHERKDDIPILLEFHLDRIFDRLKHRVIFTDNAQEVLSQYAWPGNIRELENFLERMVILHRDQVIDEKELDPIYKQKKMPTATLPSALSMSDQTPFNIKEYIANAERQMIEFALDQSNGIIQAAADYLSLGKTTLMEKMKKYNLIKDSN